MTVWQDGDDLSPTNLNNKGGSAVSTVGFSTNTLQSETGSRIRIRATDLQMIQGASQTTSGILLSEVAASDHSGRKLNITPADSSDRINMQIYPGSDMTRLSGRNAQIIIYGWSDGTSWERFGLSYFNGGWIIDSTALNSGVTSSIVITTNGGPQFVIDESTTVSLHTSNTVSNSTAMLFIGDGTSTDRESLIMHADSPRLHWSTGTAHNNWRASAQDDYSATWQLSSSEQPASNDPTQGDFDPRLLVTNTGSVVAGLSNLTDQSTYGFLHIPSYESTQAPTGSVSTFSGGDVALCFNRTTNSLHVYDGAWSGVSLS